MAASSNGEHTTLLSYAAFELRLEIERVALELLARMQRLTAEDWNTLQSFGKMEARIYQLEGHQRHIDRKIELSNVMLEALQVDWRLQPINLGELRRAWHECSELCHITWSLIAATPAADSARQEVFGGHTLRSWSGTPPRIWGLLPCDSASAGATPRMAGTASLT